MGDCRFCEKTSHKWLGKNIKCYVYHCYYHGNRKVAQGHARFPTTQDQFKGECVEANYLCVRSRYCNPSCAAYTEKPDDYLTDSADR